MMRLPPLACLALALALAGCVSFTPMRMSLERHEPDGARRALADAMVKRMGPSFPQRYAFHSFVVTSDERFGVIHFSARSPGDAPFGVVVFHLTERPQLRTFSGSNGQYKLQLTDMTYCSFPTKALATVRGAAVDFDFFDPNAKPLAEYCLSNPHPETNAWVTTQAELSSLASLMASVFPHAVYATE